MSNEDLARRIAGTDAPADWRKCQVVSFNAGPPKTVTVLVDGDGDAVGPIGCLAGYAPTVGDWVWVKTMPGTWIVIDKEG